MWLNCIRIVAALFLLATSPASSLAAVFERFPSAPFEVPTLQLDCFQRDGFRQFALGETKLALLSNVLSSNEIAVLKDDALALQAAGFGTPRAGVMTKTSTTDIRMGVHQIWLQSPECLPFMNCIGNMDVRRRLYQWVDRFRWTLEQSGRFDNSLPSNLVELSYLLYDAKGGAYAKHLDRSAVVGSDHVRAVSFVLYLGGGSDDESSWNCSRDGGALRIHLDDETTVADITPEAGNLLVFDSAHVIHEVLPTWRRRLCIVGWFRTPTAIGSRLR